MSASDLGVLLPKKIFGPKNVILRLYCRYLQIGIRYRDWKTALHSAITPLHVYQIRELWSTDGENGTVFQSTQNQLFRTLISQGLRGVAP